LIRNTPVANWIRSAVDGAVADAAVRSALRTLALAPVLVPRHIELLSEAGEGRAAVDDALLRELHALGFFEQARSADTEARHRLVPGIRAVLLEDARINHPGEYRHWNRLFAEALVRHGGRDEIWIALVHARAGEHWELMAALWARHSLGLLNRNFPASVAAYSDLPEEAVQEYPGLRLAQVVLTSLGASAGVGPGIWLRAATSTARQLAATVRSVPTADGLIGLVSAVIVHQRVSGAIAAARATADDIERELAQRAERGDLASDANRAWWQLQRAVTLLLDDALAESIALATQAYELAVGAGIDAEHVSANATAHLALCTVLIGSELDAAAWLAVMPPHRGGRWYDAVSRVPARIAETVVATDRLERERAAAAAEAMGDGSGPIEMWPFAASAAARYQLTFGDPVVMLAEFDRVERTQALHGRMGAAGGALMLARTRADGLIACADAARAVEVLETVAHELFQVKPDAVPELLLPLARAHLYGGQSKKAARLALQAVNSTRVWHGDQLEAYFIVAEAQLRDGDQRAAAEMFARAHALATRRRAWRAYLGIPTESLDTLLTAIGAELPEGAGGIRAFTAIYPESAPIAELTGRENVVLGQLAEGGSTASIAASLSVSPNTVKSQIASIYAKLGVRDRATALVVAEQRGLIRREA
ncbi:helix-turn-helix transcriptional regulator, partial [Kitasatospora indigofera]|uniref:helix-turn-helix transcriptional regulator n=1 Tax=Kitasatospora indigofera TaxID=67307 RepID=UPI0036BA221D